MAQVRICGGAELERHGWTVNPLVQTERARIGQPQPKTSSSQSYPDRVDGPVKSLNGEPGFSGCSGRG